MFVKQQIRTIKDLREYLDQQEAEWTAMDQYYMGDFELQNIDVPYFTHDSRFVGYGPPEIGVGPVVNLTFETPGSVMGRPVRRVHPKAALRGGQDV